MERDLAQEMDGLHRQMAEMKRQLGEMERFLQGQAEQRQGTNAGATGREKQIAGLATADADDAAHTGMLYYSGSYRGGRYDYRWQPQERKVGGLLAVDGEKAAKILAAIGHKQRLDILKAVLQEPLTGPELVEKLGMGTTGQLYHHIKALAGADLLVQEERGGRYTVSGSRALPLLLLLAASGDLLDTSDYIDMTAVRANPADFFGGVPAAGDPNPLLLALAENGVLEHRAGFCSELHIFLHEDGSATVSDNGRGIPVHVLAAQDKPNVQAVLTDMRRQAEHAAFRAPGAEKGISPVVVNALSTRLTVDIRRDGHVYRQEYRNGIPQTPLAVVGVTQETGTGVTFEPNRELFAAGFDRGALELRIAEWRAAYPGLQVHLSGA